MLSPPCQVDWKDLCVVYVSNWQEAEINAALYLRALGYADAQTTQGGADGGIDVRATGALAQVKHESRPVGAPTVQKLVGARARDINADLFFFSRNGYTAKAVSYGDQMDVALFTYDLTGGFEPANGAAAQAISRAAMSSPRSAPDPRTVLDAWVLRNTTHPDQESHLKQYWAHWARTVSFMAVVYSIWDGVKHGSPWPVYDGYLMLFGMALWWLSESVVKRKKRWRARHDRIRELAVDFGLSAETEAASNALRAAAEDVLERTPGVMAALRRETQFEVMRRVQAAYPDLRAGEALGLVRGLLGEVPDSAPAETQSTPVVRALISGFEEGRRFHDEVHARPQPARVQEAGPTFDDWAEENTSPADEDDFGFDYWQLIISRDEVEAEDIGRALAFFKGFLASTAIALEWREQVSFAIHGYDDDPRELWEVPEVRAYLVALDNEFPYWMWFLDKSVGSLQVILLAHVDVERVASGRLRYDRDSMEQLLDGWWIPKAQLVASYVGLERQELDVLAERARTYAAQGPSAFVRLG